MSEISSQQVGTSTQGAAEARSADGTERLMNWNTVAAAIGLVLSVATLAFTVWFSRVLKLQADLMAPAASMAGRMDADINRSIAALRGWVAYGDPKFVDQHQEIWGEIHTAYDDFRELAEPQLKPEQTKGLDTFRIKLNELKYFQWAIQDVAHAPGNEPANTDYQEHIVPIRSSIDRAFRSGTAPARAEITRDPDLFFQLVVFHAQLMATDTALQAYVRDGSAVVLREYQLQAEELQTTAAAIERGLANKEGTKSPALDALAGFVATEFGAYRAQATRLIRARQHRSGTAAQTLFRYRLQPLASIVSSRMRYISTVQARATSRSAGLFRWMGLVVVAGALLIGIMCLSTLYVSFRVRRRVSHALERAKKLGQYSIERKLGAGGMGEVYLARHAMLRRPAAVKLLRSDTGVDRKARERFRTEVQLTSRLTHPNTVEIFDYGVTPDGIFYYAMEYLEGATLQQIVDATGPMPPGRVLHVLRQVAGSLQEAHELGLLHRDIKPANIMLCTLGGITDSVKVLDFGLVRDFGAEPGGDAEPGDARLEGTPLYLAPETIVEANGSEERSDLYALGAVGYFLLCGSPPFESRDVVELLGKHLSEPPRPPSDRIGRKLDSELEQIVLDCLAKNPEHRPASARELRERLDRCVPSEAWGEADRETWWAEFGQVVEAALATGGDESSARASLKRGLAVRIETTVRSA